MQEDIYLVIFPPLMYKKYNIFKEQLYKDEEITTEESICLPNHELVKCYFFLSNMTFWIHDNFRLKKKQGKRLC